MTSTLDCGVCAGIGIVSFLLVFISILASSRLDLQCMLFIQIFSAHGTIFNIFTIVIQETTIEPSLAVGV